MAKQTSKKIEQIVDEELVEQLPAEEALSEAVSVSETVSEPVACDCYIVQDGDSYASLGKKFAPAGVRGFDHAQKLIGLNKGKTLIVGQEIKVI